MKIDRPMIEQPDPVTLSTAGVRRRRRIPLVWIVPVLTALIAAWLTWDTFSKRGPTITISFETASDLTAGQSQLKFKDVTIGTVKTITLPPDLSNVIVTVETLREAEHLLTDKTIFWVVKPQLFAAVVFLTIFAAEGFDPRLMWDAAARNTHRPLALRSWSRKAPA